MVPVLSSWKGTSTNTLSNLAQGSKFVFDGFEPSFFIHNQLISTGTIADI